MSKDAAFFMDEARFMEAVMQLADAADRFDPEWARLLRERPAVYVPHRIYYKVPDRPESGVGCCQFPEEHAIHSNPWL
jgi:hypothetical protein